MVVLNDQEKKAFAALAQSRNGQEILKVLQRRKDELVRGWLGNLDPNHGAHMRGKVSELEELISLVNNQSLSQSKE